MWLLNAIEAKRHCKIFSRPFLFQVCCQTTGLHFLKGIFQRNPSWTGESSCLSTFLFFRIKLEREKQFLTTGWEMPQAAGFIKSTQHFGEDLSQYSLGSLLRTSCISYEPFIHTRLELSHMLESACPSSAVLTSSSLAISKAVTGGCHTWSHSSTE